MEPIEEDERRAPNPQSMYLLQFRNGYLCSRCVVTRGTLQLFTLDRTYNGPQSFPYPTSVRIAGRIRAFAAGLPLQESGSLRGIWTYKGSGQLILPWENPTRNRLLATKYGRFVRTKEEIRYVQETLQSELRSELSDRTRRRYRQATGSEPHVDALIQMTVEHYARYSDALRAGGHLFRDEGRFSLETMLRARRYTDLLEVRAEARVPTPPDVWDARRKEIVEYSMLLAFKFPRPDLWGDRLLRIAEEGAIYGIQPQVGQGSWMLLEELPTMPDARSDASKKGWSRPFYVLRRGLDTLIGYLEREGSSFVLLTNGKSGRAAVSFRQDELPNLRRVCGIAVPV